MEKAKMGPKKLLSRPKLHVKPNASAETTVKSDLEEWKKSRTPVKPDNQLDLSENELKEEVTKILTVKNPHKDESLVQFSYRENTFVPFVPTSDLVELLKIEGVCLAKDSPEGKAQMLVEGLDPSTFKFIEDVEEIKAEEEDVKEELIEINAENIPEVNEPEDPDADEEKEDEPEQEPEPEEEAPPTPGKPKKVTNQFNYCERAALTYTYPRRTVDTQTIPPPRGTLNGQVMQSLIYDTYIVDFAEKEKETEAQSKKSHFETKKKKTSARKQNGSAEMQKRLALCWKTLERMVNLNMYDEIAQDYRYWEDLSDSYVPQVGTLLPLWKFTYEKARKLTVTDICWNPWYYDFFAVTFGSFNYLEFTNGIVCMFTLKNPSYPEHICMTDTAAMTVDVHKTYPYYVLVGLFDGNVYVYNVHVTCDQPQYRSNAVLSKHNGIVWEVKWGEQLPDGELTFFSSGGDGVINYWVLMQTELSLTSILTLYMTMDPVAGPDGAQFKLKCSGTCIIFHPSDPTIYLVGTEEGLILKCSKTYSTIYLLTYRAHDMPVYRIDYNKFDANIFISCSADWRVKIWEDNRTEPLFAFDLGAPVGDVKWAPYSSTVFAAVTVDGRVHVFDLNENKYEPICNQIVVSKRKNKLTRLAFNHELPILVVGDDNGTLNTLKLSPNLRIAVKPPKKQQVVDQRTLQIQKLDKLLSLVREPTVLERPVDFSDKKSEY